MVVKLHLSFPDCPWGGEKLSDERRTSPRFDFEVPVTVKVNDAELRTVTEDLSSHGVQFSIAEEHANELPEDVELTLTLGKELTLANPREVWCHARVVRKVRTTIKTISVSAEIVEYCNLPKGSA